MRLQVPALSTDQGRHCKSLAERILSALGKTKPRAAAAAFFFSFAAQAVLCTLGYIGWCFVGISLHSWEICQRG